MYYLLLFHFLVIQLYSFGCRSLILYLLANLFNVGKSDNILLYGICLQIFLWPFDPYCNVQGDNGHKIRSWQLYGK